MKKYLFELAEDAVDLGKRERMIVATGGSIEQEINRLVSITALAIDRTEAHWEKYISHDDLAGAIDIAEFYRHWNPDGKSTLVPHNPEGFGQAIDALILIARVALGDMESDRGGGK